MSTTNSTRQAQAVRYQVFRNSSVPVVDGCTHCKHVAEHLRSVGIEVELRPVVDAIPSSLFEGDPGSGFRDDLVSEYEEVR